MLLGGLIETIWLWFYSSMFFLPQGASDEAVHHRAILHSQGPRHAEMVRPTHATGGWVTTTFF
jgi:hypothetical protein